jgi:hypothetical protein
MADVTGSIGNEYVELNNAATEATLRLLLQATLATTKAQKDAIKDLATKAGLDPAVVAAMNTNVKQSAGIFSTLATVGTATANKIRILDSSISPLIKSLTDGSAQVSNVFGAFEAMPGILGVVATGFRRLAEFQEKNLDMYQQVSTAGVNFGGSLTTLRQSALNTYMTLDQFTNLMKTNGETFSKLGGTANDGAKAFVKASNSLLSSDAGTKLRALGFTTEEVNQGMLNYLSITGGRSRAELQDTAALTKSTTVYLQELDQLAAITGKSREEQQKKVKAEMEEAEFQLFLASKSKPERELIEQNVKRATVLYGKGGADIAKASAMGVAVQGDAGKRLTATSASTAEAIQRDLALRRQFGAQSKEVYDNEIKGRQSNARDLGRLAGPVGSFSGVLKGNEEAVLLAARDRVAGEKEVAEQYSTAARERAEREASQAKAAVEAQKAVQEFGQAINNLLGPIVTLLTPVINGLATGISKLVKGFDAITFGFGGIALAAGAAVLALRKLAATSAASDAGGTGGGGAGGGKGITGSLVKKLGIAGTVIGGLMLAGELSGINDQEKAGSISAGDASTQRGGAIGEAAGGFTGALAGAAAGGLMGGPLGALIGGLIGGFGGGTAGRMGGEAFAGPKAAAGAIIESPMNIKVGEEEPELISPIRYFNNLQSELSTLNKQTADMIRYLKETAEYSKRNVDATKSLSGNLFR